MDHQIKLESTILTLLITLRSCITLSGECRTELNNPLKSVAWHRQPVSLGMRQHWPGLMLLRSVTSNPALSCLIPLRRRPLQLSDTSGQQPPIHTCKFLSYFCLEPTMSVTELLYCDQPFDVCTAHTTTLLSPADTELGYGPRLSFHQRSHNSPPMP